MAVATAVLVGALTVGNSVRGSLRTLALDGLGRVRFAVTSQRLFRQEVVDAMQQDDLYQGRFFRAAPVILLRGSAESGAIDDTRRSGGISVIGCNEMFWKLGAFRLRKPLVGSVVAVTRSLAEELGVTEGDEVLIRVPLGASLPAESLLGEKDDTVASRRFRVSAVLPPKGLARFSLSPSQHLPKNAFVSLDTLQEMLDAPGRVNSILAEGQPPRSTLENISARKASSPSNWLYTLFRILQGNLQLDDYGLHVERVQRRDASYINITSDGLVLSPKVVQLASRALENVEVQPAITYLANTISIGKRKIPYSMITGIESTKSLGPLYDDAGQPLRITDGEIVLNDWAAEQLDAKPGDPVILRFYDPESTHGQLREQPPVTLTLKAIVPLEMPDGEPTPVADRNLMPRIEGVTDQKSVGDWDVPFPLNEKIRPEDEAYWDEYTTTPKAFISLALARRLWSSRYGVITSLRLPAEEETVDSVEDALLGILDPRQFGFSVQPVREQALAAAHGATSFDMLFLGFSMFLIAAAVVLIALLFRLGIQLRASELGVLTAVGIPMRRVQQMLGGEAVIIAAIGAGVGVLFGIGYAWLMLAGLRTLWLAAIVTPFMQLYVSVWSLLLGWLLGMAAALIPCWLAIRKAVRVPPRSLLSGKFSSHTIKIGHETRWLFWVAAILMLAAIGLGFHGMGKSGEAQAGAFFGAGAIALVAMLLVLHRSLLQNVSGVRNSYPFFLPSPLVQLAVQSASRNPGRSLLCISLVAFASFVIVAISAFRLDTGGDGAGGFDLVAESDVPIQYDLTTSDGRLELGFGDEDDRRLTNVDIHALRVCDGDDASCLNMYRPRRPRVLGVPKSLTKRGGFKWAKAEGNNSWLLLERPLGKDEHGRPIIPVVLDADTATYAMHLGGVGTRFTVDDPVTGQIAFEIVGLLSKSLLQGVLLVSEENFLRLYPRSGGYRFFLMDYHARDDQQIHIATILESTLGDYGFDATQTRQQLAALYAVQNTYLSTFQSLGGLGLLLGTFGLAAVQLRSVFERREELALMRAVGFRRRWLARLVFWENGMLLVAGMVVGIIAAVVALLPHWFDAGASLPWTGVAAMLAAILVIGTTAGGLAARKVIRAPLMPALRGE